MNRAPFFASRLTLRCASWMVPSAERKEWLREWQAELWHVAQACSPREVAAFTRGAFEDARTLRQDLETSERPLARHTQKLVLTSSPAKCLLLLLFAGLASVAVAFLLPGTRAALLPSPYHDPRTLVLVSRDGSERLRAPSVSFGEFRHWQQVAHNVFFDLAFYQVVHRQVHIGHGRSAEFSIVRTSSNLAALLQTSGLPSIADAEVPQLVLSDAVWRKKFGAAPDVAGRVVFLMGEKARIAGVAAPDVWQLPGKADAWLLESDARMQSLGEGAGVFVVARMLPKLTRDASKESWHMTVPQPNGNLDGFTCDSVKHYTRQPFGIFLFAAMLALLALPATTSLPLGEYPYRPDQQPLSLRLRRWLFLSAKLLLILPVTGFASLDVAQAFRDVQSAQFIITFAFALAAFRWMLRDQRRRCPVCLEMLRNPVLVGQASRNFLAWNGTELICVTGHGVLHVPELPTSWFGTQRWLYLDASWRSIFSPQEMPGIT